MAAITLALGIGASTAVFSIVDGALLRPLPYGDPARLIKILDASVREKELAKIFASYQDFEEYAKDATSIERIAAAAWAVLPGAVLTGRGHAKNYLTIPVTADFFGTLGAAAAQSRTFTRDDVGSGCAVVVSDSFWRNALGADPAVAGQTVTLDDRACVVRGVMPAGFAFYPPTTQIRTLLEPDDPRLKRPFGVFMVARLKAGATAEQAEAELTALHAALHANDTVEKDFRLATRLPSRRLAPGWPVRR